MTVDKKIYRYAILGMLAATVVSCQAGGTGSRRTAQEAAQELASLSVEVGSLERTIAQGAELAWESSAEAVALEIGREPNAREQERIRQILQTVLAEYLTPELWTEKIAGVYARNFTADELEQIVRFYGSPVGRKVLELEDRLTEEVDSGMEEVLEPRLDEFIARVDDELAKVFEELAGEGS